jgi:hypothetical protein
VGEEGERNFQSMNIFLYFQIPLQWQSQVTQRRREGEGKALDINNEDILRERRGGGGGESG